MPPFYTTPPPHIKENPMNMTQADKEYLAETRRDHDNDLARTLEKEARRGLNKNPDFGKTQREIDNDRASLECD
jgi:hypothetical protein